MADNVLTDEEIKWCEDHRKEIELFSTDSFAGHISIEDRQMYEHLAFKVNGGPFPISWTCSPCLKQIGRTIKRGLE